ncbi:hypothetical protein Hsw_3402 [Hymenobacter swuensis DY53]|uniref:Uncharacterized protein n=1 Tax=Hymenobacter swuensis DY53 TaxID=1227739 RepID=W8F4Q8_9BACT|nr:hypothetical protein Hsw_3402 [Hymenobacter swuensis DY53]
MLYSKVRHCQKKIRQTAFFSGLAGLIKLPTAAPAISLSL